MASRKSKGRKAAPAEDEPTQNAVAETAAEATAVEDAQTVSVPATDSIEFDAVASERALVACAGVYSSSMTAVSEAMDATSPFLNFAQKARIRALSVDFETRRLASSSPTATATAPAAAAVSSAPVESGLDQEAVERIVTHRVDLAVQQVLQGLGVSQGQTLQSEMEKQLGGQEHRLLDYVKRHLTESLEMLEASLEDRIAELLDGEEATHDDEARARAEVDEQVEAAKEELEKNISEVRDGELGFNLSEFMDGVAGMVSADSSADGLDGEIELGGDSIEIEAPEVELGGEEIELGGEEIELGDGDVVADEDEEDAGPTIVGDDDLNEVVADVRELAEVDPAISVGAAQFVDLPMDAEEIELGGEELEADEAGDEAFGDEIVLDGDGVELADGDSIVDLELDSGDVEQIPEAPADAPAEAAAESVEVNLAEDGGDAELELEEDSAADAGAIDRYLQRAAEMRERQQSAAAMELYNKVLDIDEAHYEARIGRGVLHLESKDYKRAIDQFSRAEEIDPSRPASSLGLAEVHFHRKQFNKAIRHYTQTLKLDDTLAQAYCNRGLSYYYQKNYKKAFLDLMRAYDIDPDLPNIKKYLKLVRNKVKTDS